MNKITRSIVETEISFSRVEYNEEKLEEFKCEPITIVGKVNKTNAQKIIKKYYGKDDNYIVTDIKYRNKRYEMEVSKFIEHAVLITSISDMFEEENE